MYNQNLMNSDLGTSGLFRGRLLKDGDNIRVCVPGIHSENALNPDGSLKDGYDISMFPIIQWCAYNIESTEYENVDKLAFIMFENGDTKRPVAISYCVIGGGSGSNGDGDSEENDNSDDTPKIDVDLIVSDSELINKVVTWAVNIANDDSHGYVYGGKGPTNYDCSGFIWAAYNTNGLSSLSYATTSNMKSTYSSYGFVDVTHSINLSTGEGLLAGDILLNKSGGHVDMYIGNGQRVGAHSSKTGIYVDNYGWNQSGYNNKYDIILRYNKQ